MSTDQQDRIKELREKLTGLPGRLVVISGPSAGAGKGKVIRDLLEIAGEEMWLSVSKTTRQVRADDTIHHTYIFVSLEEFEQSEARGEFLEANGVTEGDRYGTPLQPIIDHLRGGRIVLLEIDIYGARFVREVLPEALLIFIKPTHGSFEDDIHELRRRLEKRGTNGAASMERRLQAAEDELQKAHEWEIYDRWVVNATGESEAAAREIYRLVHGQEGSR